MCQKDHKGCFRRAGPERVQTLVHPLPEGGLPRPLGRASPGGLQKAPAVPAVSILAEPLTPLGVDALWITYG